MAVLSKRPFIIVTICTLVFYACNKLFSLYTSYSGNYASFHHSLEKLYLIFWLMAMAVIAAVLFAYKKNPDNTGYIFMGATLLQMGIAYILLRPILLGASETLRFEKIHFFFIFIIFLTLETIVTIRLLNKKQ